LYFSVNYNSVFSFNLNQIEVFIWWKKMRKQLRVMLAIFAFASVCFGFTAVIQSSVGVDATDPDNYSWPMYQNDLRHSGYSPSAGPMGNLTLWKYTTNAFRTAHNS
jgi:hypothetical protein